MPIGKLEPFDLGSKQWQPYIRRVRQYIVLNEVKDTLHVPLLITVVGETTYTLMCDLCSPAHPETKSFNDLVALVGNHLEPQRSEIAERHVFRLRRQKTGESLTDYLTNLKHLATTCNFGSNLEENLRDQFVSGLASEAMRSRIFAERNIRYKEAVELALALEAAEKHAQVSGSVTAGDSSEAATSTAGDGLHYTRGGRAGPRAGSAGATRGKREAPPAVRASACWRCGKAHIAEKCRYKNYSCDTCGQKGHLKVMCKAGHASGDRHNYVSEGSDEEMFNIKVTCQGNNPYFIPLTIDNQVIECEVDTGSRISAISEVTYKKLFCNKKLVTDNLILSSYSGSAIESRGFIEVEVTFGDVTVRFLRLYVIKGGARPLLGRDWMRALKITQININEINDDQWVNQLRKQFPEVFNYKLGTCKRLIQLQLTDKEPVYVRARPVPLALRARVERELGRLEADGSIYRVEYSDYGTPIVPVVKQNGEIRICGDYKITINQKLKRDYYPLPRIEELFANLSGGKKFTKIDLKHAYEQCILTDDSQPYTAITTHVGTFVYRRTPYGLSSIPEQFQKLMEETLRGVPGCVVFLDDICVTGVNDSDHKKNLTAVLERLREAGLTVKLSKCKFLQESVKYVGFIINKDGLRPDPTKLEAISNAPRPQNISQLKSFLGMINYYGRFIPNLSTMLQPLHNLLKKEVTWEWSPKCEQTFISAKQSLLSERVLAHYSEGQQLVLSVDSSSYGLGAVLAHRYPDGSERPVSCVSRTLSSAERNYSQLDKEALAILFGVTKHHQYLFARRFILRTDHQPLTHIFGEKGGIPQTAASRLQRWAARLAAYDFSIEFVRSADNGPADALSRLPLTQEGRSAHALDYLNVVEDCLPICYKDIAKETERDALLSKIKGYVLFGWPSEPSSDVERPYFDRKKDFGIEQGCIFYKYRITVPHSLQNKILNEIHEGHLGMNKMKSLSRSYVYWASLDRDIEQVCRSCAACRTVLDAPPRSQLHPWEFPLHPWQRIHVDFADCGGRRYLILVDAHSKWIEAVPMQGTNADRTINVLRSIFARFGLPSQLVSDNGPPFSSLEFKEYCKNNCIKHTTSAPYRPQGNGAAENAVKTVKKAIKRALFERVDVDAALYKFLFQYRNCDHATTGVSPAVALQGRRLRNRLDVLRPDRAAAVRDRQEQQVARAAGKERNFDVGDAVLVRDYSARGEKWAEASVTKKTGPVSYKVDVGKGIEWRRHADQMIPRNSKTRYSLSRTSDVTVTTDRNGKPEVDKDADLDSYEDASDGDNGSRDQSLGVQGEPTPVAQPPHPLPARPATPPTATSSPPPDASARALRALVRAKRTILNLLE